MVGTRWTPPNNPSLTFPERVAFSSLSAFLGGHEWQRFPSFDSHALGFAEFGGANATVGDHFISTGLGDIYTTSPSFWMFTSSGWMAWDMDSWLYTPPSTGLTVGDGFQKAEVLREGRYMNIEYRFAFGTTSSVSGAWTATYDIPSSSNTTGLTFDYQARFETQPSFPTEFNEHGMAEFTDNTPLTAILGGIRIETASVFRFVTLPKVTVGGSDYLAYGGVTSTVPWTWAPSDQIWGHIRFMID